MARRRHARAACSLIPTIGMTVKGVAAVRAVAIDIDDERSPSGLRRGPDMANQAECSSSTGPVRRSRAHAPTASTESQIGPDRFDASGIHTFLYRRMADARKAGRAFNCMHELAYNAGAWAIRSTFLQSNKFLLS